VLSVFSPHSCRHPRPTLFPYTTLFRSRDEHAAREAALARAAVERFGDHADGAIEIGIGHDDDEVLRAAERLDTFTGVRCALVDMLRDRRRADERYRANAGMIADRVDDVLAPVDEIDDAGRQIRLLQQFHHLA